MRGVWTLLALMMIALSISVANAQDADTEDADIVLDTVVVTGVQNDDAMAAFRAGDYAKAEIGFLNNARCAQRRARNLAAIGDGFDRANRSADTGQAPTGTSDFVPGNVDQRTKRTCDHRGFQLYMAGLSQIQLGFTDTAKRNFEKATVFSKTLYDAHYKLALIALLDGDTTEAKRQLKKVDRILKRCRRCPARAEIISRQEHLNKAIKGEVELY